MLQAPCTGSTRLGAGSGKYYGMKNSVYLRKNNEYRKGFSDRNSAKWPDIALDTFGCVLQFDVMTVAILSDARPAYHQMYCNLRL